MIITVSEVARFRGCYKANTSRVSCPTSHISSRERTRKKVNMEQDTTEGEYLIPFQKLLTNVEKMGFHVKKDTSNTHIHSTHIVIYQEKSAHIICDLFSLCFKSRYNYNRVKCNTFLMQYEIYINRINFSGILEHYR